MSLDISKLENVQRKDGKIIARCPACAAKGQDVSGDHLFIHENTGAYVCVANLEDRAHSKEIYALVGSGGQANRKGPVPVRIRRPACANVAPKTIMVLDWLKKPVVTAKLNDAEATQAKPQPEICLPLPAPEPASNLATRNRSRFSTVPSLTSPERLRELQSNQN